MPIIIKTNEMKFKDSNGNYQTFNAVAQESIAQQLADIASAGQDQVTAIQEKGAETYASIPNDYTELSDDVTDLKSTLNYNKTVTPGYIMTATNVGTGQIWSPVGTPTDEQTATAVSEWLDNHPESTTTVDFKIVTKIFDTVSHLQSDSTLKNNDNVRTNGYYSVNDGGGAYYKISTTASRACSVSLANGLYANLIGDSFNTRQIGLKNGDNGQEIINSYISDTTFRCLTILDGIHVQKEQTSTAIDNIELIKIRRDNFIISFEQGGKIILDTLHEDYYRILAIREAENIEVRNPCLVGDAETIGITTGEYGHGLYIYDSQDIKVYDGKIGKCFGDGVVVTTGSKNVSFVGSLYIYDCGRQGMTVSGCDGLYIDTIIGKNIRRTEPGAVIDFESSTASADRKSVAAIDNIYAYDCNRAFLVADKSDKDIVVRNICSYHTDSNYVNDIQIIGCLTGTTQPKVNVYCGNITVFDACKNVLRFGYWNGDMSVVVDNVCVKGMHKASTNSADESTVYFVSNVNNIDLKSVKVLNNDSAYENISIYARPEVSLSNIHVKYFDDCTQRVTSQLNSAALSNVLISQNIPNNTVYYLCSSEEVFYKYRLINFGIRSKCSNFTVVNLNGLSFALYKTYVSDYTIVDSQSIVTDDNTSYWTVNCGFGIVSLRFDHTAKTIIVKAIT